MQVHFSPDIPMYSTEKLCFIHRKRTGNKIVTVSGRKNYFSGLTLYLGGLLAKVVLCVRPSLERPCLCSTTTRGVRGGKMGLISSLPDPGSRR